MKTLIFAIFLGDCEPTLVIAFPVIFYVFTARAKTKQDEKELFWTDGLQVNISS